MTLKDLDPRRLVPATSNGRRVSVLAAAALVMGTGAFVVTQTGAAPEPPAPTPVPVEGATVATSVAAEVTEPAPAAVEVLPEPAGLEVRVEGPRIEPVARPEHVRGLYLNAWAAGSSRKLAKLIDIAQRTEVNSFVIDVKEGGELSYRSSIPLVRQVEADRRHIADPRALLQRLKDAGIYPIARIVVFKDRTLAEHRPDWAIQREDGSIWVDRDGHTWVDSFNRHVWDYNIAIAREALELGFAEVQWDYVRFPDTPPSLMASARFPAQAGRRKDDAIREFLLYSREQLASYGVPVTADVFGLAVSVRGDMGIGQHWEKMMDATDVLLPMVYPSHFARGSYGIAHPNAAPYETVKKAMEYAVERTPTSAGHATIRPWLQDFTLGPPRYDASRVRAQIQAVYDAGLSEWVLWNPGSNYTVAALADAAGNPPVLPDPAPVRTVAAPPGERLLGVPID